MVPFFRNSAIDAAATGAGEIVRSEDALRTPTILDGSRFDWYRREFENEYAPIGPTEVMLVNDLARQATAMERWGDAVMAIEREGARNLPQLTDSSDLDSSSTKDAVLVAAMSTDAAIQSERHCLARTRAFHRDLEKLEEIQSRRIRKNYSRNAVPEIPFFNETDCENYLLERIRSGDCRCRKCGSNSAWLLRSRQFWECRGCHTQNGLRGDTVMAHSALSLIIWFKAIHWLFWRPRITVIDLAAKIGIRRLSTVRHLAKRIRIAMGSEDVSRQIAGLDRHYRIDRSPT